MVSIERYSRYPNAKTCHNGDTEIAIEYLNSYMQFPGIPRTIRCEQAKAFKSENFEIFCQDNNIKFILAPAGDQIGTGLVEQKIQTLKRRLSVLNVDPKWAKETIANKITHIIESIKLIITTTTLITHFETHLGRPPNIQLTNILTHPNTNNLKYKIGCAIWNQDPVSEPEMDIQCRTPTTLGIGKESDEQPLISKRTTTAQKRKTISPTKIIPDKLSITFGDETFVIVN